ncbi:thiamine-phosphate kinase [Acetobacter sp. DmW_136]|uniref:thiamine-phosphate kinase n=1 Tax=Acetobacter sp. DmW_136 TaxID=2591091 RepID=UPI0012392972|nr:thiamine-phosphate kinase [Acetobacter sp. DmW_136]KAA8388411.1 thiamine-phosphate kinase [Acetobacter sp. DmW_136]
MIQNKPSNQTDLPQEFAFIRQHFSALAGAAALELRDDAAVFTPPEGRELVIAADGMVENVHFLPDDPPETIGRKLLRCNLSDLAAMGSRPEGWLLTFARPPHTTEQWVAQFCKGLKADQEQFGLQLLGGDTTSTRGPLVLSLTILGSVLPGQAIRRQGTQAGDGLWVTGTIGDGALGLRALKGEIPDPSGHLAQRYRLPQPRIGLPLYGLASAAMDISDGLLQDAGHLARENALHVTIHADTVPLSDAARQAGPKWLETCLTGGDDYEILFAVPTQHEASLLRKGALDTACGPIKVTRIGEFTQGSTGVTVVDSAGKSLQFRSHGWSHL